MHFWIRSGMLKLVGYDEVECAFLIISETTNVAARRHFVDFQTWDRYLRKQGGDVGRLPTKRFKTLMASPWTSRDIELGTRLELKKNISLCQTWIHSALSRLPTEIMHTFLDEDAYAAAKAQNSARTERNRTAKQFGQYFSPPTSISLLLDHVFSLSFPIEKALFLEPSCGDGRFFPLLQARGARHFVGYEINPRSDLPPQVVIGNFLESTNAIKQYAPVIVVGNPPFSSLPSDNDDIILDFFEHCASSAWNAAVIGFILPERCAKAEYVALVLARLKRGYVLHHASAIPESYFEFQGSMRIHKPSVIQIYCKNTQFS